MERLRGSEPQGEQEHRRDEGARRRGPEYTIVASILRDKDADGMLRELRHVGSCLVATRSSSERALPADELAALARRHFDEVLVEPDPVDALRRAHDLGKPVLVTGSLYLLGDLAQAERGAPWPA